MGKVVLNEANIRELVKETLENLILGEDNFNMGVDEIINTLENCEFKWIDECKVNDEGRGEVVIALSSSESSDEVFLTLYFYVEGYHTPYNPGNGYDMAPEGGEFNLENIDTYGGIFYYDGIEHMIENLNNQQKEYFNNILESIDKIYQEADENITDFSEEDLY